MQLDGRAVAVGLPVASDRIPGHRPLLTGMPVRTAFLESQPLPDWVPISDGPLLVVIGGSQGAVGLNRMVRAVVPELLEQGCRIVHLTGRNDPEVGQLQHPNLVELTFSDEIPGLLQHADLAVSRAGAGSDCPSMERWRRQGITHTVQYGLAAEGGVAPKP